MSAEQNIRTLYEWVQYLKTQLERLKGEVDGLAERVSQIEKKVEGKEKESEKGK